MNWLEGLLLFVTLTTMIAIGGCMDKDSSTESDGSNVKVPAMELTGRVVDNAGILSANVKVSLTKKLEQLERESGPQFVIATTESLGGESIEDYSLNLARQWAVGNSERDDGVVLLVAPNDRKVRIEVGYGLEGSLNDPFCTKVIKETILPAFEKGELETGIVAGSNRLIEKMKLVPTIPANDNRTMENSEEKIAS